MTTTMSDRPSGYDIVEREGLVAVELTESEIESLLYPHAPQPGRTSAFHKLYPSLRQFKEARDQSKPELESVCEHGVSIPDHPGDCLCMNDGSHTFCVSCEPEVAP